MDVTHCNIMWHFDMFVTLKVFKLIGPSNDGQRQGRGTYLHVYKLTCKNKKQFFWGQDLWHLSWLGVLFEQLIVRLINPTINRSTYIVRTLFKQFWDCSKKRHFPNVHGKMSNFMCICPKKWFIVSHLVSFVYCPFEELVTSLIH
jgi:hypothetical protein